MNRRPPVLPNGVRYEEDILIGNNINQDNEDNSEDYEDVNSPQERLLEEDDEIANELAQNGLHLGENGNGAAGAEHQEPK
jgi:hypothetical protein